MSYFMNRPIGRSMVILSFLGMSACVPEADNQKFFCWTDQLSGQMACTPLFANVPRGVVAEGGVSVHHGGNMPAHWVHPHAPHPAPTYSSAAAGTSGVVAVGSSGTAAASNEGVAVTGMSAAASQAGAASTSYFGSASASTSGVAVTGSAAAASAAGVAASGFGGSAAASSAGVTAVSN